MLLVLIFMTGLTMCLAQESSKDLRDFTEAQYDKPNGEKAWVYPSVRADVTTILDGHADKERKLETELASAVSVSDSLGIKLMVSEMRHRNKWYDNLELGMIAGAAFTIFVMWGVGQATP